jgi:hypothetical protein
MLPLLGLVQDPLLLRLSVWGHARWTRQMMAQRLHKLCLASRRKGR